MTTQSIKIENIKPNPFQPRSEEDPERVEKVAKSIKLTTMLQIPSGRPLPGNPECVELAFGHTRYAAYCWLNEHGEVGYDNMPINVIEGLTDEQMFTYAIKENLDRADLTPIDVARAMKCYKEQFGKTSKEISELFGVSDSAVRNKIRLLELPEDWQRLVKNGTITEGAGRELLRFLSLPASLQASKTRYESDTIESKVKKAVGKGVDSRELNNIIDSAIHQNGKEMSKKEWKNDDPFPELAENPGFVGPCRGCRNNIQIEEKPYCLDPVCYQLKYMAWVVRYLNQASQAFSIPVIEDQDRLISNYLDSYTTFNHENTMLETISSKHCDNLRLVYHEDVWYTKDSVTDKAGFPHTMIVCVKRNGTCTCQKAYQNHIQMVEKGEGEQLTEEERKEIRRQIAQQKKETEATILELQSITVNRIIDALLERNPRAWAGMIKDTNNYKMQNVFQVPPVDFQTFLELWVTKTVSEYHLPNNLDYSRNSFNRLLKACDLEPLEEPGHPASSDALLGDESPAKEPPMQVGKTRIEVFAEEEREGDSTESPDALIVGEKEQEYIDPDPIPFADLSREQAA